MLQCLGILYCQLLKKNPTEKSPLTASSDCSLNNNQLHRHLIHTSLASQIISVHSAHTGSHQLRRKIYSLESAHLCPSLRVLNKTDSRFILSYLYLWQTSPLTSSSELHQANLSSQDYPTTTTTTFRPVPRASPPSMSPLLSFSPSLQILLHVPLAVRVLEVN